jgi:hypothetical protein
LLRGANCSGSGPRGTWLSRIQKNNRVEASKTALRKLAGGTAGSHHAQAARQLLDELE